MFFTTGGGEAVETAWKAAKQYFRLKGKPDKTKVISRKVAYHGTTHGALSITGIPALKENFEPLVPSTVHVANTNAYRAAESGYDGPEDDPEAFSTWAANEIEQAIITEGPDTVAAVFLEPVQNAGGCFPPRPGTSRRCARSAIATTSCSCPTRSSAPSVGSVRCSARPATATSRT